MGYTVGRYGVRGRYIVDRWVRKYGAKGGTVIEEHAGNKTARKRARALNEWYNRERTCNNITQQPGYSSTPDKRLYRVVPERFAVTVR